MAAAVAATRIMRNGQPRPGFGPCFISGSGSICTGPVRVRLQCVFGDPGPRVSRDSEVHGFDEASSDAAANRGLGESEDVSGLLGGVELHAVPLWSLSVH